MPRLRVQRDGNCAIETFEWEKAIIRFVWHIISPAWSASLYALDAGRRFFVRAWSGVLSLLCILFIVWFVLRFVLSTAQIAGYDGLSFVSAVVYSPTTRWSQPLYLPPDANLIEIFEMTRRLESTRGDLHSARDERVADVCHPQLFPNPTSSTCPFSDSAVWDAPLVQDIYTRLEDALHELEDLRSLIVQGETVHPGDLIRLERPDFAHIGTGATWLSTLTSPFGSGLEGVSADYVKPRLNQPELALHHDVGPGACWSFPGALGHIGVQLPTDVVVEEVAIDHSQEDWDRTAAPRHMELWAQIQGREVVEQVKRWEEEGDHNPPSNVGPIFAGNKFLRIARFEYDTASTDVTQSFPVDSGFRALAIPLRVVVLLVLDNWGNANHTCLYRLRVHGRLSASIPL